MARNVALGCCFRAVPAASALLLLRPRRRTTECSQVAASGRGEKSPRIVSAILLFRHGARSPIFRLPSAQPDSEEPDHEFVTASATPAHAVKVTTKGGQQWRTEGRPGMLTRVGWSQGEALGRRLRARYGAPTPAELSVVRSTDLPRTVLTLQAVLTGLLGAGATAEAEGEGPPIVIEVDESPSTLHVPLWCQPLGRMMKAGRDALRLDPQGENRRAQGLVAEAFGPSLYNPRRCTLTHVMDDCLVRRFHAHPSASCIDVALCDMANTEAAREIYASLAFGGEEAVRLSAGPLCGELAALLRAGSGAEEGPVPPPPVRLALLSCHDTSLMMVLNALGDCGADAIVGRGGAVPRWPPYTASIAIEVLDSGKVRVLYQLEEIICEDLAVFLRRLDSKALTVEAHAMRCGEGRGQGPVTPGADGAVFRFDD